MPDGLLSASLGPNATIPCNHIVFLAFPLEWPPSQEPTALCVVAYSLEGLHGFRARIHHLGPLVWGPQRQQCDDLAMLHAWQNVAACTPLEQNGMFPPWLG